MVIPYLGVQSKIITATMPALALRLFSKALIASSVFPYMEKVNYSQMSKIVYMASCWDCQDF